MRALTTYSSRVWSTGLCGPVLALLASVWMLHHLLTSELYSFSGTVAKGYGPLSWPEAALVLLVLSTGFLCVTRTIAWLRGRPVEPGPSGSGDSYDNRSVAVGGCLIVLYGIAIVFIGFLISSVLFLAIWMLYRRMRNLVTILTISVLGTLAPLYLLVKVAYMPLPRGVGMFGAVTVKIYEWLGIF